MCSRRADQQRPARGRPPLLRAARLPRQSHRNEALPGRSRDPTAPCPGVLPGGRRAGCSRLLRRTARSSTRSPSRRRWWPRAASGSAATATSCTSACSSRSSRPARPIRPSSSTTSTRLRVRMAAAGVEVVWDDRFPGYRRFHLFDPHGNRVEIMAADRAERAGYFDRMISAAFARLARRVGADGEECATSPSTDTATSRLRLTPRRHVGRVPARACPSAKRLPPGGRGRSRPSPPPITGSSNGPARSAIDGLAAGCPWSPTFVHVADSLVDHPVAARGSRTATPPGR